MEDGVQGEDAGGEEGVIDFVAQGLDGMDGEGLGLEDVADGVGGDDGEVVGAEEAQEERGDEEGGEQGALRGFVGGGRRDHERGWYRKGVAISMGGGGEHFRQMP